LPQWKITKIVATRCQILTLKCTKFDFSWGSAPDPAGAAYSVPPDPLAEFKGPTSKGRERKEREGKLREKRGEGQRREMRKGGKDMDAPFQIPEYATVAMYSSKI